MPINTQATSISGKLSLTITLTLLLSRYPMVEELQKLALSLVHSIPNYSPLLLPSLMPQLTQLLQHPDDGVNSFSAQLTLDAKQNEDSHEDAAALPIQQVKITVPLQIQIPVTVEQPADGFVSLTLNGDDAKITHQIILQLTSFEVRQNIESLLDK